MKASRRARICGVLARWIPWTSSTSAMAESAVSGSPTRASTCLSNSATVWRLRSAVMRTLEYRIILSRSVQRLAMVLNDLFQILAEVFIQGDAGAVRLGLSDALRQ